MKRADYDTIVLGGGPVGLAAAYYSAAAGKKTLLLEKDSFFHQNGSSSGNSRFFRVMYSERDLAVLSEASYALWKQLERRSGTPLLDERPLLFFGRKEARKTVEGDFNNADRVMDELGVPYDLLTSAELRRRYPVLKSVPEHYVGLVQPDSAVIRVKNALRAFHHLAGEAGAVLRDRCAARILGVDGDSVIAVETPDGVVRASSLLVSLGSWTNETIAPLGVQFAQEIWQMTICLFEVENPRAEYPFWYEFGDPTEHGPNLFYGFPVGSDRDGCIKVSCDFTDDVHSEVGACSRRPSARLTELMSRHIGERFNGVKTEPIETSCCMYTMSKDYHMIVDLLPGYRNVAILAGESGRAFKYAPLFGRILNQLADSGECSYDIGGLSALRPGLLTKG